MRYTKKLFYTDAAVDAFHFYFKNPHYLEKLPQGPAEQRGGVTNPAAEGIVPWKYMLQENTPDAAKWEAARRTINAMERDMDGAHKIKLLKTAYGRSDCKGVTGRVRLMALEVPVSEKQAWEWIKKACFCWAEFRGLI
jgi:hypothetical protein